MAPRITAVVSFINFMREKTAVMTDASANTTLAAAARVVILHVEV